MNIEIYFKDFHDPAKQDGHGQIEWKMWVCPACDWEEDMVEGEQNMQEDRDERDIDFYMN